MDDRDLDVERIRLRRDLALAKYRSSIGRWQAFLVFVLAAMGAGLVGLASRSIRGVLFGGLTALTLFLVAVAVLAMLAHEHWLEGEFVRMEAEVERLKDRRGRP